MTISGWAPHGNRAHRADSGADGGGVAVSVTANSERKGLIRGKLPVMRARLDR